MFKANANKVSKLVAVMMVCLLLTGIDAQAKKRSRLFDTLIAIPVTVGGSLIMWNAAEMLLNSFGDHPTFKATYLDVSHLNAFNGSSWFKRAMAASFMLAGAYSAYHGGKQIGRALFGDDSEYEHE